MFCNEDTSPGSRIEESPLATSFPSLISKPVVSLIVLSNQFGETLTWKGTGSAIDLSARNFEVSATSSGGAVGSDFKRLSFVRSSGTESFSLGASTRLKAICLPPSLITFVEPGASAVSIVVRLRTPP